MIGIWMSVHVMSISRLTDICCRYDVHPNHESGYGTIKYTRKRFRKLRTANKKNLFVFKFQR